MIAAPFDPELARVLDELTVQMLEETTPRGVLARIRLDERRGLDPYLHERIGSGYREPRSELRVCAAADCAAAFWMNVTRGGLNRRFCSQRCAVRASDQQRHARRHRLPLLESAS